MTKDELKINQWYEYNNDYFVFCIGIEETRIRIDKYITPSSHFENQKTNINICDLKHLSENDKIKIYKILKKNLIKDPIRELIELKNIKLLPVYDLFIKSLLHD